MRGSPPAEVLPAERRRRHRRSHRMTGCGHKGHDDDDVSQRRANAPTGSAAGCFACLFWAYLAYALQVGHACGRGKDSVLAVIGCNWLVSMVGHVYV